MIDLSHFNLTTPELKAGTVDEAMSYPPGQFPENEFFYTTADGFVVHAPTKASGTTANSNRARCELRETTTTGKAYNFTLDQFGDSFLQAALTVLKTPKEGRTTVGQIHVKDSTRPLLKLFHDGDSVVASFRAVYDQKDPVNYKIATNTPVGQRFTYSIHVSQNGNLSIVVGVNGVKTTLSLTIDDSWRSHLLYFKAGTYIQEDATETTTAEEGSTILFDKLSIRHE